MTDPLSALRAPRREPDGVIAPASQAGGMVAPTPPGWLTETFSGCEVERERLEGPWRRAGAQARLECREKAGFRLTSVAVEDAVLWDADLFEESTASAYRAILDRVADSPASRPLRIWNFVPGILEPLAPFAHRYMAFNAGRFEAYRDRYGSAERFPATLATASGTGHEGADLVLHCLSSADPGRPIENPRQVPAYRYSARYGPRPPCFARATLASLSSLCPWLGAGPSLLVGGTASVLGEHSAHPADLEAQLVETAANLEALLEIATSSGALVEQIEVRPRHERPHPGLEAFRHLRVYHTPAAAAEPVRELVERRFRPLDSLELVCCDLCRPELLIEIEGIAALS